MDLFDPRPVDFHHFDSCQQKPNYFFPPPPRRHLPAKRKTTAKTLTTSSHYVKFICFSKAGKCHIYFRRRREELASDYKGKRMEGENEVEVEREMLEWFKWVLEYAWGLRALRNTAKMKQAAEHRGKAPIHSIIISQQWYSERHISKNKKESLHKLLRPSKHEKIWLWMHLNRFWNITFQMPPAVREMKKCVIFISQTEVSSTCRRVNLCNQLNFTLLSSL